MASFKQWGVMGDWDNPYFTYSPQFEVEQLEVFLQMYEKVLFTLILSEPKVISLCHQYRARWACTSMQSDQALYCWLINLKFSFWYPLYDNRQFQNWRWIIPFKKFSRLRVKRKCIIIVIMISFLPMILINALMDMLFIS